MNHTQVHKVKCLYSAAIVTTLLCGSGCVTERSPITGERRAYGYSWAQEVALGREADGQIIQQFGIYHDGDLQAYVNDLGQKMLESSHMRQPGTPEEYQRAPFTFRVLNSPVVNAFALPGGYIYITRGLLAHVQNEAQLAVVLGHEIAHVAARHASRQALRARAGQVGILAGAVIGAQVFENAAIAENLLQAGGQAFQLFLLRYSRDAEREADRYGVQYAVEGGYQASEAADFFSALNRIRERAGAALPQWQSTHPDPGEREQSMHELAREYHETRGPEQVGIERFMRQVDNLVIGTDPREGYVADGVFYHPELRFQFQIPANWEVRNERAMVLLQAPGGRALMAMELVQAASAREAAVSFARQQEIQVGREENVTVNGLPGVRLLGQAGSGQNQVGVLNYFIEYEGRIYSIVGLAPAAAFQNAVSTFEQTAESFRKLTERARIDVEPVRLRTQAAARTAPFRTFLPSSLPHDLTAEDLAIMNQRSLDDPVEAGEFIKLPQ